MVSLEKCSSEPQLVTTSHSLTWFFHMGRKPDPQPLLVTASTVTSDVIKEMCHPGDSSFATDTLLKNGSTLKLTVIVRWGKAMQRILIILRMLALI